MDSLGRIWSLEQLFKSMQRTMRDVLARLARAETNIQQVGGGTGGGTGGGPPAPYWCIGDGTAHVATGTWPSLTAATFTSDVYRLNGGAWELVEEDATIRWPYKDAMSTTAGKLMPCWPNRDATSYDAVLESCTAVT